MKLQKKHPVLSGTKRYSLIMSLLFPTLLIGCGEKEQPAAAAPAIKPALIEVVTLQHHDSLSFNGVVRAAERADLSFRIGGRITTIPVKEGEQVSKDQVLATLDPRDAKNALASAKLELKNIEVEYKRAKAIFEKSQAISASDLDSISTRYNLAKNRVEDAQRQLDYTEIKAPFDGIIGRKLVDNHVQIQANTPVITLHDLQDLEVVINIPHRVMLSGLNSTSAYAEIAAIPDKRFPLKLRTFATQPDPVSQTYPVVLGLENTKGVRILPGMAVKVIPAAPTSTESQVITIPLTALVPDNQGKQFVWVVNKDNIAEKRLITVGSVFKDRVSITGHLEQGEKIIIAGVSSIREGMEVRPYTDTRNGEK